MYHSHSPQERAFDFFASFLRNVLAGDTRYETVLQPIISDVKSLTTREKDYYNVDRSSYDVIIFLAEKAPDFFEHLDVNHITPDQYNHMLNLVTAQRELLLA